MNKEEKEAIRRVTEARDNIILTAFPAGDKDMTFFAMDLHTILELVDKQQKEIEELKELNKKLDAQIDLEWVENNYIEKSKYDKALKVIDKMAEKYKEDARFNPSMPYGATKEQLIEHFLKEIENE